MNTQNCVSLRVKLVLSYLGVAVGAILLMIIVATIAIQAFFYQAQINQLQAVTEDLAQHLALYYQDRGSNVADPAPASKGYLLSYLFFLDTHHTLYSSRLPGDELNFYEPTLMHALLQSLQGQQVEASLQGTTPDGSTFSAIYVSMPVQVENQIVGAVLLVQPNHYQPGFSPKDIVTNVNLVILVTGLGLALIVAICSLVLTRRLTRPLVSLTLAAEGMKSGNYAQRVEQPKALDELGRLAMTFNAMADKIAADVAELRAQEQQRRDLIANIAHDLVTPLTAIQGYSEAIADDVISEPYERHETAQLIGREVQRLRRLVSDIQHMSSLEAGRVQLELAPLNLYDLSAETLAVITPECDQAGIELRNEISPTIPAVLADSDRITQVLLNLLDNARRHTPTGGHITLGAKTEGTWLIAWVSDTGIGIRSQDLPHIFERFYRVDRSRNAASGGSGLGLAIIKALITAHGGTAWAESTLGQGTTVFFQLRLLPLPPLPTRKSEMVQV
ncbi:MAG: ATP-binding protein [Ktedonobacteraceae bacterium]